MSGFTYGSAPQRIGKSTGIINKVRGTSANRTPTGRKPEKKRTAPKPRK